MKKYNKIAALRDGLAQTREKERIRFEQSRRPNIPQHMKMGPLNTYRLEESVDVNQFMALYSQRNVASNKIHTDTDPYTDLLYIIRRVPAIYFVYQEQYQGNQYVSGLGDFIRGCFFMKQICDVAQTRLHVVVQHPIHAYLHHPPIPISSEVAHSISFLKTNNIHSQYVDENKQIHLTIQSPSDTCAKVTPYVKTQPLTKDGIYIYLIMYPLFPITSRHRAYVQSILRPSRQLEQSIFQIMSNLKLRYKDFICIHIRTGDDYLLYNINDYLFGLYTQIVAHIKRQLAILVARPILVVSDNAPLKYKVCNFLLERNVKTVALDTDIVHLGENAPKTSDSIEATLIEFYIMATATQIYSFSTLWHGSGFSQWCAEMYNIPYSCTFVQPRP